MGEWKNLTAKEKARVIQFAIDNGISDINTIRDTYNVYAQGGSINIKPENRGKFTELKERTGKSSTWYKENGTPAQKKMTTFALNARKWSHKHDTGSSLNIPTIEEGFEDWSEKYLGKSYAEDNSNIQKQQNYLDSIKNQTTSTEVDLKYAQYDLEEAIKAKQDYLKYIYNNTINTNIGESIKNPIKNILYRIMSQNAGANRSKSDIMAAIRQQIAGMPVFLNYTGGGKSSGWNNINRDLNKLYLTGEDASFERLPKDSRGFTYLDYLQKTKYNPKTYRGEILPDEIVVDPKYATALYNLIGKHTYTGGFDTQLQDDIGRYIQKVGMSPKGDIEIQASDIWDFYPGDWKGAWGVGNAISNIGSRILDKMGHPFILRDYAPIKFGNPKNNEYIPWIKDLPKYEGKDSDGTLIFSLPEFTITANSGTGKKEKTSFGSLNFNFVGTQYTESPKWYIENSYHKHEDGDYLNNAGTITTAPTSIIDDLESVYNHPLVSIGKFFDPTGISGYPDLLFDARYFANTPSSQRTSGDYLILGADILGALPFVNNLKDFSTLFKLAKTRRGASALRLTDTMLKRTPGFITDLTQSDLYQNIQKELEKSRLAARKHDGTDSDSKLHINNVDATYVASPKIVEPISLPIDMQLSEEDLNKLNHAQALYANEGLNIVSPEFDLLTLGRSIVTSPFSIGEQLLKNFRKNGEMVRVVSKEAIKDAEKTGVIRGPGAANVTQKTVSPKTTSGVSLIANKKRSFDFPYFSKETLAIKPQNGDVIIVGGKNTPWTTLFHKQKTLEDPLTLSIQELFNAKEPFGTPFVNGKVNMGPISDFRYYDINALGRVVPRQFGQSYLGANYELFSPLTYWLPSLNISEGLRKSVQAQGGYLQNQLSKPFSYKPIPAVRYDLGGFLKNLLGS